MSCSHYYNDDNNNIIVNIIIRIILISNNNNVNITIITIINVIILHKVQLFYSILFYLFCISPSSLFVQDKMRKSILEDIIIHLLLKQN